MVSGILVLLAMTGAMLASAARWAASGRSAAAARARVELAAESGMSYAAARLSRDGGYPRPSATALGRGDDWTFRDGINQPLAGALNPSYSHGEWWDEAAGEPGRFDLADSVAASADLDGDGRFSAWSGRLRGGVNPVAATFSLKIDATDGKIPLNAGAVRGNRYGTHLLDDTTTPNAVPDSRDMNVRYHLGIARVLENLGAILDPPIARRWEIPAGASSAGDPILFSPLGEDLIRNRPEGGYRDWEHVEQVLTSLTIPPGQPGYAPGDVARLRPFIDLGPYEPVSGGGRCAPQDTSSTTDFLAYVPISLTAAPREVLEAIMMYSMRVYFLDALADAADPGWAVPNTRTGPPGDPATYGFAVPNMAGQFSACIQIAPDEAGRFADRIIELCDSGPFGWGALLDRLLDSAGWACARDVQAIATAPGTSLPGPWARAKACLAFSALQMDHPSGIPPGAYAASHWNMDRDADPSNGFQSFVLLGMPSRFQRPSWSVPLQVWRWTDPMRPYNASNAEGLKTQGVTLAPPVRFEVVCSGSVREASGVSSACSRQGRLRAGERVDAAFQEDFQAAGGGQPLAARGIHLIDNPAPAARRDVRGGPRPHPHVAIPPRWDPRDYDPVPRYMRQHGFISLACREPGPSLQADFHWPFLDDLDPSTDGFSDWTGVYAFEPDGNNPRENAFTVKELRLKTPPNWPCPGLTGPAGSTAGPFTLAFWGDPGASMRLVSERLSANGTTMSVVLDLVITFSMSAGGLVCDVRADQVVVLTNFDVRSCYGRFLLPLSSCTGSLEPGRYNSIPHHFAVTIQSGDPTTRVQVYVDGRSMGDPFLPASLPPFQGREFVSIENMHLTCFQGAVTRLFPGWCDNLSVYGHVLTLAEVDALYREERFVRGGTYTSPLYRLDAPAALGQAQWSGVVPVLLHMAQDPSDPVDSPPVLDSLGYPVPLPQQQALQVKVIGYSQPDGIGQAFEKTLDTSGRVEGLPDTRIRSFRYTVHFDCSAAAGVLVESPVFESIWFTLRRPGRSGWTAWE